MYFELKRRDTYRELLWTSTISKFSGGISGGIFECITSGYLQQDLLYQQYA
jgi:hypothetical protein